MEFDGKAFVIMGATSGIGSVLCKSLAEHGASLFMTGRDAAKLEELKSSLAFYEKHQTQVVTIDEDSYAAMQSALQNYVMEYSLEGIDGAVYLPGVFPLIPLRMISKRNISDVLEINFTGAIIMFKILTNKKTRHPNGMSLVAVSSVSAHKGQKGYSLYGASKAALTSAVRSLALELAPQNIRMNCVCCAHMETAINLQLASTMKAREETLKTQHPLGIGSPEDAVNAIMYLLSEKSKWITGTEMIVDGGFLAG